MLSIRMQRLSIALGIFQVGVEAFSSFSASPVEISFGLGHVGFSLEVEVNQGEASLQPL